MGMLSFPLKPRAADAPGMEAAAEALSASTARRMMNRPEGPLKDLWQGLKLHQLWRALAWEELNQRYRRAYFGLTWVVLSFCLMVLILILVFGRGLENRTPLEFAVYMSSGLLAWQFISAGVSEGCNAFASSAGWIKGSPAPFSVLIYRAVYNNAMEFLFCSVVVAGILVMYGIPGPQAILLLLLGLAVYVINAVWAMFLFGSIGAWSSDFRLLVPALMRIAFFATPIFWDYETNTSRRSVLADYNPFFHFVQLVRAPLLGEPATAANWIVVGAITIGGWIAALIVFARARPRIASWV